MSFHVEACKCNTPAAGCEGGDLFSQCPQRLSGSCGNGCLQLLVCEDNRLVIPVWGCHPETGEELTADDFDLVEMVVSHPTFEEGDSGNVIALTLDSATSSSNFDLSSFSYQFFTDILATDTGADFIDGYSGKVSVDFWVTVAGQRYHYYSGCVEVKRPAGLDLAPPKVKVVCTQTGLLESTLDFSGSQVVHAGAEFGDLIIDWGDGSAVQTIDTSDPEGDGLIVTHDFPDTGDYVASVCLCLKKNDSEDACEPLVCERGDVAICVGENCVETVVVEGDVE